ncbi:hypothetical protein CHARACLAT_030869 [Characodon lateralis]|uniref:Uncharacterized protein n=1 Tax=Characodon lateralis TaxID=208331 RepID=A0ABU7EZA5_9TELE|nr:hypothetical protein [Characodon lateralis]
MSFLLLPRGSRRRRPYLYRKRAIHRSRPTYSYSLEEAQGSMREGRPPPPLKPSNSFMSRRERRKRMTMSVWEQRTSQLRRHRQMSSREILFSSPSEEKDGPPSSAHGRPLSLHRKVMQHTPSGSMKRPSDPLTSPAKNQPPGSSVAMDVPLDTTLAGDMPEPPMSVLESESLDPTNVPSLTLPEPPESESAGENGKLGLNKHVAERRSPRLNAERQHRHVKKFRPPENVDTLTPDKGGYIEIRGRRGHHCDHRNGTRNQASSPGNEGKLACSSDFGENRINSRKVKEKGEEPENKDGEVYKHEESRLANRNEGGNPHLKDILSGDPCPRKQDEPLDQSEMPTPNKADDNNEEKESEQDQDKPSFSVIIEVPDVQSSLELSTITVNNKDPETCKSEKEEVEETKPINSVTPDSMFIFKPDNPVRRACHYVVNLRYFEMCILLVIAASSIALAAEDPVATSSDWNKVCVHFIAHILFIRHKYLNRSRLVMVVNVQFPSAL